MSTHRAPFFVLSGGPCSGKTTTIDLLSSQGAVVVPEAATQVIQDPNTSGLRSSNLVEFQRRVLDRQLENEERALAEILNGSPGSHIFLDRSVADGFAYLAHNGEEPFPEIVEAWKRVSIRYHTVFFLEQNPAYEGAEHRAETPEIARALHEAIRGEYESRGIELVGIPWISASERVTLILKEAERRA